MKTIALIGAALLLPIAAPAQKPDTIVKLAAKPLHAGVATLREEASIGELDGEEYYLFGNVTEVAAANDGAIYVFDSQVPALRKYDASGKYVRTLGRKGQGPGEYVSGGGLSVAPDGKVYLWDTGTWRINVYSPTGDFVTSFPTPSGMGANVTFRTSRALLMDTQGRLYFRTSARTDERSRQIWVKLNQTNGAVIDTLEIPKPGQDPPMLQASLKTATSSANSSTGLPFAPQPLQQLSPLGYFVTAYPSRYAFEIPAPGSKVMSVRRDAKAEAVTSAERAEEKKRVEAIMRRTQPNWNWNGPDIPKTKSFFDSFAVGADGRVWIPRVRQGTGSSGGTTFSTSESSRGSGGGGASGPPPPRVNPPREAPKLKPGLFDIFEPNGTYVGQVATPANVSLMFRRGDHVWAIARDELDVATIKRYRIQWKS